MSNVILLKGRERAAKSMPLPAGMSAEIVIFHGVRIERISDDMQDSTAPANRRRPALRNQATAEELE